jgi:formylglycine-generating enzyme
MLQWMWWMRAMACVGVIAACSFPRPADVAGDGAIDGQGLDGAPSPPSASCIGLPATCGPAGNDDCCNSPEVPGGTFYRSYDLAGDADSGNKIFPATVSSFRLDKYEVTVGRFRAFVEAGMGTRATAPASGAGAHAHIPRSGWDLAWNTGLPATTDVLAVQLNCDPSFQTWTDLPGPNEARPMNCLSWYEAMAFCVWDGGYLPTELEWNYAAAGGDRQRAYPWSSVLAPLFLDSSYASYGDYEGMTIYHCYGDGAPGCDRTDLVEVGTKPRGDGRWGQSDLAGNVAEWTLDWYATYVNPCTDCANLTNPGQPSYRVFRGGNYLHPPALVRTGTQNFNEPTYSTTINGVRCARPLPE